MDIEAMKLEPVAFRFTENRGNGKTEFSYYSPEQLATAYRDNCLAITPLYAIPEGYVVVPLEPTKKMLDAAEKLDWGNEDVRGNLINQWQAMIAEV